jgi:hypothetical protein
MIVIGEAPHLLTKYGIATDAGTALGPFSGTHKVAVQVTAQEE